MTVTIVTLSVFMSAAGIQISVPQEFKERHTNAIRQPHLQHLFVSTELTVESQTPPKSEESLELSDKSLCENKVDAGTHLILRQTDMNLLRLACVRARKVALAYAGGNLTTFGHLLSIHTHVLSNPCATASYSGFFPVLLAQLRAGVAASVGTKCFSRQESFSFIQGNLPASMRDSAHKSYERQTQLQ